MLYYKYEAGEKSLGRLVLKLGSLKTSPNRQLPLNHVK